MSKSLWTIAGPPADSSNLGDQEERYRINAIHFTNTPTGGINQSATGDNSLATWIHFNPRELTIAPKTQRAVRFAIVPRGKLQPGEYWAAMELESLNVTIAENEDDKGRKIKLRVVPTIMVPMFGTYGDVSYKGTLDAPTLEVNPQGVYLKTTLENQGTGRIGAKCRFEVIDSQGQALIEEPLGRAYVLRDAHRIFTKAFHPEDLPAGEYKFRIICNAEHLTEPLVSQALIHWPPPEKAIQESSPAATDVNADLTSLVSRNR